MTTPCRWCSRPAVTSTVTLDRSTTVETLTVSYLCERCDGNARAAAMTDECRKQTGEPRIDAVIADVRVVAT